jgi:hypothetical protein
MTDERQQITEQIQGMVASLVATQPAGAGLCLVGGFRYRWLDRGPRRSVDVDYHWDGDLVAKQQELITVFDRRLLPDVRRRCHLEGSARAGDVRDGSDAVAVVDLAFWRLGSALGRIEIPVDVTRIERADRPEARTVDGVVYRTASNADMLESKVIAILCRPFVEHRDILDLDLFASQAAPDSPARINAKLGRLGVAESAIKRRLANLTGSAVHHAKSIDALIRNQVDATPATVLAETGGGTAVLARVTRLLAELLEVPGGPGP